jgi:hypothetical protein
MHQMRSMGGLLQRELAKIAGVPVIGIHFEVGKFNLKEKKLNK